MDFAPEPRRPKGESIVPMINVVFLLLIFFLMTATISPPDPFDTTPPDGAAEATPDPAEPLYLSAEGRVAWRGNQGEAVWQAIAAATPQRLVLRSDREADGSRVAQVLAELAIVGIDQVDLVVAGP